MSFSCRITGANLLAMAARAGGVLISTAGTREELEMRADMVAGGGDIDVRFVRGNKSEGAKKKLCRVQ